MNQDEISAYISDGILRLLRSVRKESLLTRREKWFLLRQSFIQKQKQHLRKKQDIPIPPFIIASITERCNLHCQGCYARGCGFCTDAPVREPLSPADWKRIFHEADALGISFVLLTGGEPMMNAEIIKTAATEKHLIFPVFTNGTLVDEAMLELFDASRNLVPVFSLEGGEKSTDERRGSGVFATLMDTVSKLHTQGIVFGMSITVSTANIHEITSYAFLNTLADSGVSLVFLIEYTATTERDHYLELTKEDRELLAISLSDARKRYRSIWFLSFPGDEEYMGGCLAAGRGFFHINPYGDAEPCPFSPVSDCNLKYSTLYDALHSPLFHRMKEAGLLSGMHDGGCALVGKKEEIEKLCDK